MDDFVPEPDFLASVGEGGGESRDFTMRDGVLNARTDYFDVSEDVDGLLYLGHLTDNFDLYGHSFVIRTLRRQEKLAIGQLVQEYSETIALGDAIATATVAACIMTVDGRPLSPAMSRAEENNPLLWVRRSMVEVGRWFDPIVEGVYQKYQALLRRQAQAFIDLKSK